MTFGSQIVRPGTGQHRSPRPRWRVVFADPPPMEAARAGCRAPSRTGPRPPRSVTRWAGLSRRGIVGLRPGMHGSRGPCWQPFMGTYSWTSRPLWIVHSGQLSTALGATTLEPPIRGQVGCQQRCTTSAQLGRSRRDLGRHVRCRAFDWAGDRILQLPSSRAGWCSCWIAAGPAWRR
jgi:hypothetical protein